MEYRRKESASVDIFSLSPGYHEQSRCVPIMPSLLWWASSSETLSQNKLIPS